MTGIRLLTVRACAGVVAAVFALAPAAPGFACGGNGCGGGGGGGGGGNGSSGGDPSSPPQGFSGGDGGPSGLSAVARVAATGGDAQSAAIAGLVNVIKNLSQQLAVPPPPQTVQTITVPAAAPGTRRASDGSSGRECSAAPATAANVVGILCETVAAAPAARPAPAAGVIRGGVQALGRADDTRGLMLAKAYPNMIPRPLPSSDAQPR